MSDSDQISCKICRRQFARYTCPSCNLPYCSLSCFRSPAHTQCSESFYKKELETDIRASPSKSMEEKSRMMELLKRFEEENADLDHLSDNESGDEGHIADLAERLENVDLDKADPDALWSLLTAEERSKFLSAMGNPSSDLAQQLLNSEELERDKQRPWWEASGIEDEEGTSSREIEPILIPLSMVKPSSVPNTFIYNMCAICIAYAFTVRHFAVSSFSGISPDESDHGGAIRLLSQLIPFLTEKRSTTRFTSVSDVITDIWPRFDKGQVTSQTFAILLGDCVDLLKSLPITPMSIQDTSAINPRYHPHCTPILALSDLSNLFSRTIPAGIATVKATGKPHKNHIIQKLLFYAAQIYSTPSHILHLLSSELSTNAQIMHQEQRSVELIQLTTDTGTGLSSD
ncbi:hypothetical protein JOM56_007492 [Amanita muscaria]